MEMNGDERFCDGFSLLEVMMAMVVLTVGLLAVIALFQTGMKALHAGDKQTRAAGIVQNKMESLRASSIDLLSDGQDRPEGLTRRWSIRKSEHDPRIWIIQVDVVWKNAFNQDQTVSLRTFAFF
jgi:prepilin-type N-terminal cleavage/methylation domain-containing protein